jgi:DNA-directed RNA polymerase specialized sigma24 family protein
MDTTEKANARAELDRLGRRHKSLRDQLDNLRPELRAAILTAHAAGVRQVEIAKATGYTREAVYRMTMDADAAAVA